MSHASVTYSISGGCTVKFAFSAGSRSAITQGQWLFLNDQSSPLKIDCCFSFSMFLYQAFALWSTSWLAFPRLVYFCVRMKLGQRQMQRPTSNVSMLRCGAWAGVSIAELWWECGHRDWVDILYTMRTGFLVGRRVRRIASCINAVLRVQLQHEIRGLSFGGLWIKTNEPWGYYGNIQGKQFRKKYIVCLSHL